jgi:hypothetical protein
VAERKNHTLLDVSWSILQVSWLGP